MQSRFSSRASAGSSTYAAPLLHRPAWFLALALWLVALVPRILHLDDFFTVDESFHWVWRIMHFMDALNRERWDLTNLTGHPGVTTLWLGSLGRTIAFAVGLHGPEWYKGSADYLALLRLPLAIVNSAAVAVGYLALRRLLSNGTALLAGGMWALSPFLIAHSRLLHMDALLTSFMTLCVLLLLLALVNAETPPTATIGPWLALVGAGVCGGLALLTKAPSLLLLPAVGGLLLWYSPSVGATRRVWWVIVRGVVWAVAAALVFWAGWPALWVAPGEALGHVAEEIIGNGAQPHPSGNYFLGRPVADPGWLFYPAVVLWRSTPVMLVGLLLLPLALRRHPDQRRPLLALAAFALLFALAMSMLPKKFDRYLLPIWPTLEILAAAGLMTLLDFSFWPRLLHTAGGAYRTLLLTVAALLALLNAWYHPYYLAYFNPLVGGGRTAQEVMLVGWGEGMEQVGAWLRTRPDLTRSPVMSWDPRTLEPFVPVRVVELNALNLEERASYAVLYSRGTQRQGDTSIYQEIAQTPPLYTLRQHGITYARVYQPVRPFDEPVDVLFGEGLHLRGFRQTMHGDRLEIAPAWSVEADMAGGWFCFVHVLDADGHKIAQIDAPIDEGLFATWQRGQQFGWPLPIALPPDRPPGPYRVVIGVYNPADSARLPLTRGEALPAGVDGPHVVPLTTLKLE